VSPAASSETPAETSFHLDDDRIAIEDTDGEVTGFDPPKGDAPRGDALRGDAPRGDALRRDALSAPVKALRFGPSAIATPANAITIARVLLTIPTVVLIEGTGASWLTVVLWFVLSCTDGLDGFVARRGGTTRSGAFLDPLADKVLVLGGFLALAARGDVMWAVFVVIAVRELAISGYRSLAARRGVSLPARQLGKWKTVAQLFAVGAVVFPPTEDLARFHYAVVWTAVGLTVLSAFDILRRGWQETQTAP